MDNKFKVGQVVLAETILGNFVGSVESINPTHSREGREYMTDPSTPALGLNIPQFDDTLWVPASWVTVLQ